MSDDAELLGASVRAVVGALVDETGAAEPVRAYAEYLKARVGMHYAPKLAERAMATAEKIRRSGLPYCAYGEIREPLVRAILEGAAEEDDPDLQQLWENLLGNAVTSGSAQVRAAFPRILKELEPQEAVFLDNAFVRVEQGGNMRFQHNLASPDHLALGNVGLANLDRLGLIHDPGETGPLTLIELRVTSLGMAFAQACRPPQLTE